METTPNEFDEFAARLRIEFLDEASGLLEQCEEAFLNLEAPGTRSEELAKIFRAAHTIKGSGAAVGFDDLASFAHRFEDFLSLLRGNPDLLTTEVISLLFRSGDALKERIAMLKQSPEAPWNVEDLSRDIDDMVGRLAGAETSQSTQVVTAAAVAVRPAAASIKVDAARIDAMLDLVGELVVIKSQLVNKTERYATDLGLTGVVSLFEKTIRELQDRALGIRLTPLKSLFLRMQRLVRDLSLKIEKPVDLVTVGEDTEIDRTMVEELADPLLHLIRNALDHGIETTAHRESCGKLTRGRISLTAQQSGGRVTLKITDDGAGINRQRVLDKAVARGLVAEKGASELADKDVYELLFEPGFSTAAELSDLSGRGVGLDVVKTQMAKLKGSIEVESEQGRGTSFTLSIPLTASILDGMLVSVREHKYVLPMALIRELRKVDRAAVVRAGPNLRAINVRGRVLPVRALREYLFDEPQADDIAGSVVVVVETGGSQLALIVDDVIGQGQVVLKPLATDFQDVKGVAGGAVLGDGRVALVLDVHGIVKEFLAASEPQRGEAA